MLWAKIRETLVWKDYRQKHQEVTVLDPPNAVEHLHNRQSMLQGVAYLNLSDCHGRVGVPKQLIVTKDPLSLPNEVDKAGLNGRPCTRKHNWTSFEKNILRFVISGTFGTRQ